MTIKEWCKRIHDLARVKGWYDKPRTPLEIHMLIVSEVAEASEEVRNGKPDFYPNDKDPDKPEGEMIELADSVIRIMDYFEYKGWDLEDAIHTKHVYNVTRKYRHGGKLA